VKRTKTDFQFEIQTTSTSLEPLDIFFVQQQHSTSSELGLNIFKLAGEFICESPWSPRSGKPPTPEKQHINKLRHRLIFTHLQESRNIAECDKIVQQHNDFERLFGKIFMKLR